MDDRASTLKSIIDIDLKAYSVLAGSHIKLVKYVTVEICTYIDHPQSILEFSTVKPFYIGSLYIWWKPRVSLFAKPLL